MTISATWGAIFDWDGVVIDSSRQHELSWEMLSSEEGKPLPPDHFKNGFGRKNEFIIPNLLKWTDDSNEIRRLSLRKEELYREIVVREGIRPLEGVGTWLDRLHQAGVPCVIGSSTHRLNIETVLDVMGFRKHFAAMVTSEDVSHGKPHPEVFLKAAEKISRQPSRCVVFEDAHVGVEAALAGGMKVVAVVGTHNAETFHGKATRVVHRLDEIFPDDLAKLF